MNSLTAKALLLIAMGVLLGISGCKQAAPVTSSLSSIPSTDSPLLSLNNLPASAPTDTASAGSSIPPAPKIDAHAYVIMDANSGAFIAESNGNEQLQVASLTKLMTSYIVFDALNIGKLKLDDIVTVSEHAWKTGGATTDSSTSFLPIGAQVTASTLIQGMIVQLRQRCCHCTGGTHCRQRKISSRN